MKKHQKPLPSPAPAPALAPTPTATRVPDEDFKAMKSALYHAIHEIVFVVHHLDEDDVEAAQESLLQASLNLEQVGIDLLKFVKT